MTDGSMHGQMDGWMEGRWLGGWVNRLTSECYIASPTSQSQRALLMMVTLMFGPLVKEVWRPH